MGYKKYIVLTSLLILLVAFPVTALANPSKNPNFPTIDEVTQLISDALAPLTQTVNNLVSRLNQTEQGLNDLELQIPPLSNSISQLQTFNTTTTAQIADLNGRVSGLEDGAGNPEPPGKPYSYNAFLLPTNECQTGETCINIQICGPVLARAKATLPSGETVIPVTGEISRRQLTSGCGPTEFRLSSLNTGDSVHIDTELWWGEKYYTESQILTAP